MDGRELIDHLKHFEGFVGHPYLCAAGKLTIGYGHRIEDPNHQDISESQATGLLMNDVAKYTMAACSASPNLVNQPVRRLFAIIDFCFNCGANAYLGSHLHEKVNAAQWVAAAAEMRKWVYVTDPKTQKKNKSAWQIARREVCAKWLENPL